MRLSSPSSAGPWSAAVFLGATLVAGSAFAQAPEPDENDAASAAARAHYNAGTKAFAEARFAEAALAFEAAAEAKPSPIALFTAALSWDRTNAPDRAADDYTRALALPGLPADKTAQAHERLAVLEASLGAVTVTGADGAHAQLDGSSEHALPATLHGAAGVHTLLVRSAGGAIDRRTVVLERGKTTLVDATAPVALPPPAPPPRPAALEREDPARRTPNEWPRDWKKVAGVAALGVGGATLLAGVALGVEAEDAKNAYVGAPTHATYDHASGLQTWTNVAFVAGGVIAAGGLALVLWPSHAPGEATASSSAAAAMKIDVSLWPGGAVVKGAF